METKGIIATTHVDRHGEKIAKETLEELVKMINAGTEAITVSVEHDGLAMPIGKVIKGELVQLDDGEFAVKASQEIFKYSVIEQNSNETYYMAKSNSDNRPFADLRNENTNKFIASIDPNNFTNENFIEIINLLQEKDVAIDLKIRKSLMPDPEIIFHLVAGTLTYWTGKKVIGKLADEISTDISNCYGIIKKAIMKFAQYSMPENRPKTYLLREKDEYVKELAIQTADPDIVIEALHPDKLEEAEKAIEKSLKQFSIYPAKVQIIYDVDKKKWKLNYLLSTSGQVIGTEICYKRTIDLLDQIGSAEGAIAVSVAGLMTEFPETSKKDE